MMMEKYEHDVDQSSPSLEAHSGLYGVEPQPQYHNADVFGDEEGHQVSQSLPPCPILLDDSDLANHVLVIRSITKPYHGNSSPC